MPAHAVVWPCLARWVAPLLSVLAFVSAAVSGHDCLAGDIDDLVRNVESNEALYKNIQFTYKEDYIDHSAKNKDGRPILVIQKDESTRRLVYQGGKVFSREEGTSTNFGSAEEDADLHVYAWDGRVCHDLNLKILHITDEAADMARWPRPHNLLLPDFRRIPLSVLCKGGPPRAVSEGVISTTAPKSLAESNSAATRASSSRL